MKETDKSIEHLALKTGILVQTSRQITAIHGFNLKLDDDPTDTNHGPSGEGKNISMVRELKCSVSFSRASSFWYSSRELHAQLLVKN